LFKPVHDLGVGVAPGHRGGELGQNIGSPCPPTAVYSSAELKTIPEIIALIVSADFTAIYFDEPLSWTQAGGFSLIALGAALVFHGQA
jgi:uncharacterized protein (DUF486 family)